MTLVILPWKPNESYDTAPPAGSPAYRRWDQFGNIVESRPTLTDSETAAVNAYLAAPAAAAAQATAIANLSAAVQGVTFGKGPSPTYGKGQAVLFFNTGIAGDQPAEIVAITDGPNPGDNLSLIIGSPIRGSYGRAQIQIFAGDSDTAPAIFVTASGGVNLNGGAGFIGQSTQRVVEWTTTQFVVHGAFCTASGPTSARPTASSVPVSAQFYDTTLTKPVWSDGTNWRDAAGTVV